MKLKRSFLLALLFVGFEAFSAELDLDNLELSDEEEQCFAWFNNTNRTNPGTMGALAPEDRKVWDDCTKYMDDKDAFVKSRVHYVALMLKRAQAAGLETPCDYDTLVTAVLKKRVAVELGKLPIKNEIDARMVAHAALTAGEQKTWVPASYAKDPEAANAVVPKWSHLVVELMVQHGLLADTAEVRAEKEQGLIKQQVERLKTTYSYQAKASGEKK